MTLNVTNVFQSSLDNVQDEFYNSISDKSVVQYYVGGDYDYAEIANSVAETELATYIIPANTIINGIRITIVCGNQVGAGETNTVTFRIKAGADGAEITQITTTNAIQASAANGQFVMFPFTCALTSLDWETVQSISITAQNSVADTSRKGIINELHIEGF